MLGEQASRDKRRQRREKWDKDDNDRYQNMLHAYTTRLQAIVIMDINVSHLKSDNYTETPNFSIQSIKH